MVYLIHFDTPYPRDRRTVGVQHYLGFVNTYSPSARGTVLRRLAYHRSGRGARLMDAVTKRGIGWRVVRVWWEGDRHLERKMKRRKQASVFCPVCQGKRVRLRAPYWRAFAGSQDGSRDRSPDLLTGAREGSSVLLSGNNAST